MATKSAAATWRRSSARAGSKFDFVTFFRGKVDEGCADDEEELDRARDSARDRALTGR